MSQESILKEARTAFYIRDLPKLQALIHSTEEPPNSATMSAILESASASDYFWSIVTEICLIEGDNQPTQAAINKAVQSSTIINNFDRVRFFYEQSKVKPNSEATDIILTSTRQYYNKHWDLASYLCALTSDNKPSAKAMSELLRVLPADKQFDLIKTLCRMVGDNQPSQAVIDAIFVHDNIKYNLEMLTFLCEESTTKPSRVPIETVLDCAGAYYSKSWDIVRYLCALDSENKPSQAAIDKALASLTHHNELKLVETLCRMAGDNQPSQAAIDAIFAHDNIKYNLEMLTFLCEASTTKPSRASIETVLGCASDYYSKNWGIVSYLCALKSENKPSQAIIDKVLARLVANNEFGLVETLCRMDGDNQPSQAAIDAIFVHDNIKYNLKMLTFLCEASTTQPSRASIETVLGCASDYYSKNWGIVSYLCALDSENKPSQAVMDKVLTRLTANKQFAKIKDICSMQGTNRPSQDAIDIVFRDPIIISDLAMVQFMCEQSFTKPSQPAVDAVLESASAYYNNNWVVVSYLCALQTTNQPTQLAVDKALQRAAASSDATLDTFKSIFYMTSDNKPSKAGIVNALLHAAAKNRVEHLQLMCEITDERRPDTKATAAAFNNAALAGALDAVKFFASMTADNKPEPDAYKEALQNAASANRTSVVEYFCLQDKTITINQDLMDEILCSAASGSALAVAQFLFSDSMAIKPTPAAVTRALLLSIQHDHPGMIKYFTDPANKFELDKTELDTYLFRCANNLKEGGLRSVQILVRMQPRLVSDMGITLALNAARVSRKDDEVVTALENALKPPTAAAKSLPHTRQAPTIFAPKLIEPGKSPEQSFNESLITKLNTYIERIASSKNPDGSINFTAGFWFFWNARAENRRANYNLAVYLRDKLIKYPNLDITQLFSDLEIEAKREKKTPGISESAWVKGIHSAELNDIINDAKAFIEKQGPKI